MDREEKDREGWDVIGHHQCCCDPEAGRDADERGERGGRLGAGVGGNTLLLMEGGGKLSIPESSLHRRLPGMEPPPGGGVPLQTGRAQTRSGP